MATDQECLYLRERLHELLVERESAPKDLVLRWQAHQCEECSRIWQQLQGEQERGERLLKSLAARVPSRVPQYRLRPVALSACVVLALSLGLLWHALSGTGERRGIPGEDSATTRETIAHALLAGGYNYPREIEPVIEEISRHLQETRREFEAISALLDSYENAPGTRDIPLLRLRLKLHCRLALITPDTIDKLSLLEQQGYPVSGIGQLFAFPIGNLGTAPESEKRIVSFFQESSPHLLSILRHRRELLDKIGFSNVRDLGGEIEALALIDRIENAVIFKGL